MASRCWQATIGANAIKFLAYTRHTMSEDEAARFRKQAEECREQAAKAFSPLDKEAWLRTAEEWIKLAMSVEERRE
jgi:hypothetical protein